MRCRFLFVGATDPVSCCFFIVFRFSLKNYAVNLSFMVIEKNGKLPDTKAAQDTMLDLIFPICETKDRQCMGWGSPCTVIIPESPLRIISRNPRLFNCRCSSQLFNKPFLYLAGKTWYNTRVKKSKAWCRSVCRRRFDFENCKTDR